MIIINDEKKFEIRNELEKYCGRFPSRNSAAQSLKNVSASTIHSVLNEKWENISDVMWKSIRDQVTPLSKGLVIVETQTFKELHFVLKNAQHEKCMTWFIAKSGAGKTTTAEYYKEQYKNVIYLLCDEDMKKSDLANELARAAGLRINTQKRAREKIMLVIDAIIEMDDPIIIFDEADKLADNILYYFITMYNHFRNKVGIVALSTPYMIRRMENGLRYGKKGFEELFSRIGGKFYESGENTANNVFSICMANGVTERKEIDEVLKEASQCDLDLRRVDTKMRSIKKQRQLSA